MMKKYYVKNVENYPSYTELTLKPRSHRDELLFASGQYAAIGFKVKGRPSPMRCFSMVSSPSSQSELQFALRVQGNFTRALSKLSIGDEVCLEGPYGNFVLDPTDDRPAILLAGGIGITPFMSMLRAATETGSQKRLTLLYGCRTQDDIPFYEEILQLQAKNPRFNAIFFINDGLTTPPPNATAVSGRIDARRLQQLTGGNYSQFTYYICGPDGFRDGLESILEANGVDKLHILTESFSQINKIEAAFGISMPTFTYVLASVALVALVGFITTLDLKQTIARSTTPTSTPATTSTVEIPSTTNSTATSQSTNTAQQAAPTTTDTATTPVTTTPTYTNTYRQPTSSVS